MTHSGPYVMNYYNKQEIVLIPLLLDDPLWDKQWLNVREG